MEQYRIIKALSGFYYVQTEDGVVECRARGRFRRQDQSPLVGDFVRITRQGAGKGVLEELLPRKNALEAKCGAYRGIVAYANLLTSKNMLKRAQKREYGQMNVELENDSKLFNGFICFSKF